MKNQQRGAALIIALFIMVIVAITAVALAFRLQVAIKRTELMLNNTKLYAFSQSVKYWAITILIQNTKSNNKGIILDKLPQTFPNLASNGMVVTGDLTDLQAKLNLNSILNPVIAKSFENLLTAIAPNMSTDQALEITRYIQNYLLTRKLTNSSESLTNNPMLGLYTMGSGIIPYPFASISELQLIPGMTPAIVQALTPFITALPRPTAINVNTATAPVLKSLGMGLTDNQVTQIIALRKSKNGFQSVLDFLNDPIIKTFNIPIPEVTVTSNYFLSRSYANFNKQQLVIFDIIYRTFVQNVIQVNIVSESQGTL